MDYRFKDSILGKIVLVVVVPAIIAIVSSIISIILINRTTQIDRKIADEFYPFILVLKKAQIYTNESYQLTSNWIYQPSIQDKEKLTHLHDLQFLPICNEIEKFKLITQEDSTRQFIDRFILSLKGINSEEKAITNILQTDDAYGDDVLVDKAIYQFERSLTPGYKKMLVLFDNALARQDRLLAKAEGDKQFYFNLLKVIYFCIIILFLIHAFSTLFSAVGNIVRPIVLLNTITSKISLGKLVDIPPVTTNDEISAMYKSVEKMVQAIREKVIFAESIGSGKYDCTLSLASEDDRMGIALIGMRNSLKENAEEEDKRRWAAEGFSKFSDLLRSDGKNNEKYFSIIISNLVKYIEANQGSIFILSEGTPDSPPYLELKACYAYDRKKIVTKQVDVGEGMLGQVYLERQSCYITDLPDKYTSITSGLGEATPSCLLIVPLYANGNGIGVIELASFKKLEPYKIAFVEKLCTSIASEINNLKSIHATKDLLSKSTVQTEKLLIKEEELRQNLEELTAIQESMNRKEKEYINRIEHLTTEVDMLRRARQPMKGTVKVD